MPTPLPTGSLVTRDTLAAQLRALGVTPGEILLVHSSLSSLGWVDGGAVAVVQGLLDALGPDGTLAVPTQSGDLSDPALWGNPPVPEEWWETIRATMPAHGPRTTPTRGVGVIPETVRTRPGALRSAHPRTSFAAVGPRAAEIVEATRPTAAWAGGTAHALKAVGEQPAGPAGGPGRPCAAAGGRIRLLHLLPPGRVPHTLAARSGGSAGTEGMGSGDRGVDHFRALRRTGARLRAGQARRAGKGGRGPGAAVPGRGRGGLRGAVADTAQAARRVVSGRCRPRCNRFPAPLVRCPGRLPRLWTHGK